jgi:hypothetical protein
VFTLGITLNLHAQQNVGNILGAVTDPTGAVVPNASLTARHVATGQQTQASTNAEGTYVLSGLPIGEYAITIRASGFNTLEQTKVRVLSSVTLTLDFQLEVGTSTQSVQVTAGAPVLDTSAGTTGTTRAAEELGELPVMQQGVQRASISFLRTIPGVSPVQQADDTISSIGIMTSTINGTSAGSGQMTYDGVPAMTSVHGGLGDWFSAPPEAIEEMRVTSTTSSEYGWNGGVTVAMVTKSGTNNLHGTLYEFLRNDALDSRNFFAPNVAVNKQNEFGFTLGGPLYLPHIYNGKKQDLLLWNVRGIPVSYDTYRKNIYRPDALDAARRFQSVVGTADRDRSSRPPGLSG